MCIRDSIVDEATLGVDVMNAYGFIVDFKNNVFRIGGEEVMLSTMTLSLIHIWKEILWELHQCHSCQTDTT